MKKLNQTLKALWNDESAQGATEYILLLVIVVGIALAFKSKIKGLIDNKLNDVGSGMDQLKADGN